MSKQAPNRCEYFWDARAPDYADDFGRAPIRAFTTDEFVAFVATQRPRSLLDLGSGAGMIAMRLAEQFPDLQMTLVDFSEAMLEQARRRLPDDGRHRFLRTGFDDLSMVRDNSVDVAISSFALHHVVDDKKAKALRELRRVLGPRARALIIDEIICNPAFEDPARLFRHMGDLFYPWLSEAQLQQKFAGFEEYPTTLGSFVAMCRAASLSAVARPLNGIVASVSLTPIDMKG